MFDLVNCCAPTCRCSQQEVVRIEDRENDSLAKAKSTALRYMNKQIYPLESLIEMTVAEEVASHTPAIGSVSKPSLPKLKDNASGSFSPLGNRLLLIEQRAFRRRILANCFRSWGLSVAVARSFVDAIRVLDTEPEFDFVIYDQVFMGGAGKRLAGHCRNCRDLNQIKLISLSSSTRVLSNGFFGMLGFSFLDTGER